MSKRLVINTPDCKVWLMATLEGRIIHCQFDPKTRNAWDVAEAAKKAIPRGWKVSRDRQTVVRENAVDIPLRRATRGIGR